MYSKSKYKNKYKIEYISNYKNSLKYTRRDFMKEFKPIKQEKTVISIRLDNTLLKAIDKVSNDADISRNELIVQCIKYALDNFSSSKK